MRSSRGWRPSAIALLLVLALGALGGCALWRPWRPGIGDCPGPLRATGTLGPDFLWRERVRYRAPEVQASLELVVQKRGDALVVVGFNELGAKAFAVTQRGTHVEAESFLGPALAVPPRTALHDLHRARLGGSAASAATGPVTLVPEGCGYEVTFARLETRALD